MRKGGQLKCSTNLLRGSLPQQAWFCNSLLPTYVFLHNKAYKLPPLRFGGQGRQFKHNCCSKKSCNTTLSCTAIVPLTHFTKVTATSDGNICSAWRALLARLWPPRKCQATDSKLKQELIAKYAGIKALLHRTVSTWRKGVLFPVRGHPVKNACKWNNKQVVNRCIVAKRLASVLAKVNDSNVMSMYLATDIVGIGKPASTLGFCIAGMAT